MRSSEGCRRRGNDAAKNNERQAQCHGAGGRNLEYFQCVFRQLHDAAALFFDNHPAPMQLDKSPAFRNVDKTHLHHPSNSFMKTKFLFSLYRLSLPEILKKHANFRNSPFVPTSHLLAKAGRVCYIIRGRKMFSQARPNSCMSANPRRASADKGLRLFLSFLHYRTSKKRPPRRKPHFQPTDTKASTVQDFAQGIPLAVLKHNQMMVSHQKKWILRRAYRLRY